jgi:hypothetical protein
MSVKQQFGYAAKRINGDGVDMKPAELQSFILGNGTIITSSAVVPSLEDAGAAGLSAGIFSNLGEQLATFTLHGQTITAPVVDRLDVNPNTFDPNIFSNMGEPSGRLEVPDLPKIDPSQLINKQVPPDGGLVIKVLDHLGATDPQKIAEVPELEALNEALALDRASSGGENFSRLLDGINRGEQGDPDALNAIVNDVAKAMPSSPEGPPMNAADIPAKPAVATPKGLGM